MGNQQSPNVDLEQALNARANWALSRIEAFPDEQRADYRETAEYNAWLGGYMNYPNPHVPALVTDVPELRRQWADGRLQREIQVADQANKQ
jgi:hypothetical protein